ncbi:MAG TPA: hypothetical protein VKN99_21800 [Polyangia bacterium]|nr:hypothetical protein [Polyangia bacterium]
MGFAIDWHSLLPMVPAEVRALAEVRLAKLWEALAQAVACESSSTAFRMTVEAWSIFYTIDFPARQIRIRQAYSGKP